MHRVRILLSIIFTLVAIYATGSTVSYNKANSIARDFLGIGSENQIDTIQPKSLSLDNDNHPFYIFTDQNGRFVIISGDDRAHKILAYGEKWIQHDIPESLGILLEGYAAQINSIDSNAPSTWGTESTTPTEKLLKTVSWGQEAPFNNLAPSGLQSGCVATAMATVMKYHNWPETGRGFHSYEWGGQMLSWDYAATTFDWANMLDHYSETDGYNDIQADAVAQLMKACGVAVDMYYSSDGSAATIYDAAIALNKYFRYDGDCQYLSSSDFSDTAWAELMRKEIDAERPIIYSGKSSSGSGHAFVCDGYNNDGLFHFNWGWNGACDGFYALNALKPLFTDYSMRGAMVINITPSTSDTTYAPLITANSGMGLSIDTENIEPGTLFNAFVGGISTTDDTYQWNGQIALALVDSTGTIKEIIRTIELDITSMAELSTEFTGCIASSETESGDRLQLLAKSVTSWQPIRGTVVRPASCPARGNTVRRGNITWDLHPADMQIFINPDCGNTSLSQPILSSPFKWTAQIPANAASIYYAIDGKEVTHTNGSCAISSINHDYTITIHAYSSDELITGYTINVPSPGTLAGMIDTNDAKRISSISITGTIDSRDFDFMREQMVSLSSIDIGQATINSRLSNYARHIPANAFDGCSRLNSITLPQNLVGIHPYAFRKTSISNIDIPASVTKIEDGAFYMAGNLSQVTARNPRPADINSRVFFGTKRNSGILYIPIGSYEQYKAHSFWGMFGKIIEDENITGIHASPINSSPEIIAGNSSVTIVTSTPINCSIYSLDGVLRHQSLIESSTTIKLPHGNCIYIISIENKSRLIKIY